MEYCMSGKFRIWNPELVRGICRVRSAGHYIVPPNYHGLRMRKDFFELFWGVRGRGRFRHDGRDFLLSPGEIFCYFPGDVHDFFSGNDDWEFCWITLDGPQLAGLTGSFGFRRQLCFAGPCPEELFDELCRTLVKQDQRSAVQTSFLGYEILLKAANPLPQPENRITEQYKTIVAQNFPRTDFSVADAAEELGLHRSSLHRIIREHCGVSPQEYLLSYRLEKAAQLLLSGVPIKEIAERCGFSGTNYFTKAFRKRLGTPPAGFRRERMG